MTRLPFEILLMIFERIDLINLIKLRLICKDWKSIIDNNKIIKELTIVENGLNLENNEAIYLDQFVLDGSKIFRKIIGSNVVHNLKYLNYSFNCYWPDKNKLNHLNCFRLLEHLVLTIDLREDFVRLILVHPNLKIVSVSANFDYDSFKMEINCPKCENLRIDGYAQMKSYDVIYPERIKILKISICDLYSNEYEIGKFMNIEQLVMRIHCFEHDDEIGPKISKFIKLKKLKIRCNFRVLCENYCVCLNCIKDQLYKLINQVQISKKQIQIYLNDEEMNSKKQFENYMDKLIGPLDYLSCDD